MIGGVILTFMPTSTVNPPDQPGGVLAERGSSPGLLLAVLGHHAMRRLRGAHTSNGLSPRQFQILGLLQDRGPTGQRELGQQIEADPSVLVALLNPLEDAGLLSRVRAAEDRRRHLVSITAPGRRRLGAAAKAQREAEDELFAGLDNDQREQLQALLVTLRESLSGDCTSAAEEVCGEAPDLGAERDVGSLTGGR
jgi:DNA-binding MarR family transcriptional regulator